MAVRAQSTYELKSVEEVHCIVQQHTSALEAVGVSHTAALGAVLAADVMASDDLPPFPASIKVSAASFVRVLECSQFCGEVELVSQFAHACATSL